MGARPFRNLVVGLGASLLLAIPTHATVPSSDVKSQTSDEARAQDLALIAEGRGWSIEDAAALLHSADVIGSIAEKVYRERPAIFVGSAVSLDPIGPPTLYVKGSADSYVRDLVQGSPLEVVLADNQPYSFDELEERKNRVHAGLVAQGFADVATGVNISGGGVIRAGVGTDSAAAGSIEVILGRLPADLQHGVELSLVDRAGFRDSSSFGGMLVTKNGANYATSGWTVKNGSGITGVTTAGHATGTNGIVHPGHGSHSFVFQSEHRGQWGDIEWHTTNQTEEATFYADATSVRQTLYLEPRAGISLNEPVCQYGRFSNDRDCSRYVYDVSIECTLSGVWNDRLVQVDAITSEPGDSGGGWSLVNTAFGSQKGWCSARDAFSVADLYDEALGVQFVIFE